MKTTLRIALLVILFFAPASLQAQDWVFGDSSELVLSSRDKQSWVLPFEDKRVLFFTADWCVQCQTIKAQQLPKLREAGWSVGESHDATIQVINIDENPELWQKHGSQPDGLPQFVCLYGDQVVRSLRAGCATPMDAWGISWVYKGVDERPEPKREPVTADSNGIYPVRGNWWSVEGVWNADRDYVINHLLTSPNHPTLRPHADRIRKLSRVEAHSLHSDDHEGRVDWAALRGEKKLVSQVDSPLRYNQYKQPSSKETIYQKAYRKSRSGFNLWPFKSAGRISTPRRRVLGLCPT